LSKIKILGIIGPILDDSKDLALTFEICSLNAHHKFKIVIITYSHINQIKDLNDV